MIDDDGIPEEASPESRMFAALVGALHETARARGLMDVPQVILDGHKVIERFPADADRDQIAVSLAAALGIVLAGSRANVRQAALQSVRLIMTLTDSAYGDLSWD